MAPIGRMAKLSPRLKAFFLVAFLFTLGNSSNQFLLLRANYLGFKAADVILVYLLYNIVYALSAYPAGRLSDRIGRRTILVCGYLFYGIVYLGFSMASESCTSGLIRCLRALQRPDRGVEKALVAELWPCREQGDDVRHSRDSRRIGLLPASVVGGLLWRMISPEATFYFGGVVGLLSALGMFLVVPKLTQAACPK